MSKGKRGKKRLRPDEMDAEGAMQIPGEEPANESASDAVEIPKPPEKKKGLECAVCGCRQFRVVWTKPGWGGRIMRKRACRHCGRETLTFEKAAGAQ